MTIYSVGYDGAIGELDWSQYLAPYIGSPPMVVGAGDFAVTPVTGTLTVRVAPGIAHGNGITDRSDGAETIRVRPVTSGVRYDCIVIRRDWNEPSSTTPSGAMTGGHTLLGVVEGGSARAIPSLKKDGGVLTEQPLALVKVAAGVASVEVSDDLRVTHTKAAYVRSQLAMTGPVGSRYVLEPDGKRYVMMKTDQSGVATPVLEVPFEQFKMPTIPVVERGTQAVTFGSTGVGHINHTLNRVPKTVLAAARTTETSGLVDISLTTQPGAVNDKFFAINAKIVDAAAASGWKPYVGSLTYVDWIAIG